MKTLILTFAGMALVLSLSSCAQDPQQRGRDLGDVTAPPRDEVALGRPTAEAATRVERAY